MHSHVVFDNYCLNAVHFLHSLIPSISSCFSMFIWSHNSWENNDFFFWHMSRCISLKNLLLTKLEAKCSDDGLMICESINVNWGGNLVECFGFMAMMNANDAVCKYWMMDACEVQFCLLDLDFYVLDLDLWMKKYSCCFLIVRLMNWHKKFVENVKEK